MKKGKKIVACALSALIVSTTLSLSGCGFGRVKTEDEIYAALVGATKEFLERKDALTIKMTITQEGSGWKEAKESKIVYSVNPEEEKMFFTLKSEDEEMTMKLFEVDGNPLVVRRVKANKSTTTGSTMVETENYNSATPTTVAQLTSLFWFSTYANFDLEQLFRDYVYSFSETKAAYESVYAEQLEKEKKRDKNVDASFEMNADKSFNKIFYELSTQITTGGFITGGNYGYYTVVNKEKLVGKRGKISEVFVVNEVSHTPKNGGRRTYKNTSIHLEFDDSFDKKGYKAIKTDAPNSISPLNFIPQNMQMQFHINGCVAKKTTEVHSFNASFIFQELSKDYYKRGFAIEWFKDDTYTNPFSADNLSYAQFRDIKNIYGKLTINDGYAVVAHDYTVRDNRTDAYKAVFGPVSGNSHERDTLEAKYVVNDATFSLPVVNDNYQAFIDGKEYDETSNTISLENGKFYHLEIAEVITNEGYSIFDVDTSTLRAW